MAPMLSGPSVASEACSTVRSMRVKINSKGVRELYKEIAVKIEAADRAFRETHTGYPEDVVLADIDDALPITLDGDGKAAYARAVSKGEPFQFRLT